MLLVRNPGAIACVGERAQRRPPAGMAGSLRRVSFPQSGGRSSAQASKPAKHSLTTRPSVLGSMIPPPVRGGAHARLPRSFGLPFEASTLVDCGWRWHFKRRGHLELSLTARAFQDLSTHGIEGVDGSAERTCPDLRGVGEDSHSIFLHFRRWRSHSATVAKLGSGSSDRLRSSSCGSASTSPTTRS